MSESTMTLTPAAAPLADLLVAAQEILARYPAGRERSALLPLLHLVQSREGYVSPTGVTFCAEVLGINKAQVGAVATFYTMYKRRPTGDYLVSVCTNTMCNVLGGQEVYDGLVEHLGVGHDETTADGTITLEHAECLAACDYGPVMTVNYDFYDNVTPESAVGLVDGLRAGERPAPTRGARLCTLKEMYLQLAGFPDEREGAMADGPAGAATLRGVTLAQEHGISVANFDPESAIPQTKPAPAAPQATGSATAPAAPQATGSATAPAAPQATGSATAPATGHSDGKVATAAKKMAGTVKAAASAVAEALPGDHGSRKAAEKTAAPATQDAATGGVAGSTTRDVASGDVKDPEVRAAEARGSDAGTPAPDAPGTTIPDGGARPSTPDARAAEDAGLAANKPSGDGKPADDKPTPQERNLRGAEEAQ